MIAPSSQTLGVVWVSIWVSKRRDCIKKDYGYKQKNRLFGGFFNGGGTRIRTLEGYANRFTGR
jgi:hypothetical protein